MKVCTVTHGHTCFGRESPVYVTWKNMVQRCTDSKSDRWKFYGAKGIRVCDRWRSFENFLTDMGERPEGKTLDRIEVSKGYEPGNCRWLDKKKQAQNTRSNVNLSFDGRTFCISEWERVLGFKAGTLKRRLMYGWSVERILTTPVFNRGQK